MTLAYSSIIDCIIKGERVPKCFATNHLKLRENHYTRSIYEFVQADPNQVMLTCHQMINIKNGLELHH